MQPPPEKPKLRQPAGSPSASNSSRRRATSPASPQSGPLLSGTAHPPAAQRSLPSARDNLRDSGKFNKLMGNSLHRGNSFPTATSPRQLSHASSPGPANRCTTADGGGSLHTPMISANGLQVSARHYQTGVVTEENGANASTCASSACAESVQTEAAGTSSRVLFAKASELIRVEIAASERRIAARFEQERTRVDAAHDSLKEDLTSMLAIVETLSAKAAGSPPSSALVPPAGASPMSARYEQDRWQLDATCSAMLTRLDALNEQVQSLPTVEMIAEERRAIHTLVERERKARSLEVVNLQKEIANMSDELHSIPSAQFNDAACWNKFNVLLEHERLSRDTTCRQLRNDVNSLMSSTKSSLGHTRSKSDEDWLHQLFDQERAKNDLSNATLRKDFYKEVEALSMDIQSLKTSMPPVNEERIQSMLEQQQTEIHGTCAKLQQDVESLAFEMRCSPRAPGSNAQAGEASQPSPGMSLSPLESRLESTAHLAFQPAFESVFASSARS